MVTETLLFESGDVELIVDEVLGGDHEWLNFVFLTSYLLFFTWSEFVKCRYHILPIIIIMAKRIVNPNEEKYSKNLHKNKTI